MPLRSPGMENQKLRGKTACGFRARELADYCLSYDGVDDTVIVPHHSSLAVTSVTLEAWICVFKTGPATLTFLMKGANDYNIYYQPHYDYQIIFLIQTVGGGMSYVVARPGATSHALQFPNDPERFTTYASRDWAHCVGTYDAATAIMKIFINSQEKVPSQAVGTPSGNLVQSTNNVALGSWFDGVSCCFHRGLTRAARIYNRALTPSEILFNMNSKTPISDGLVLDLPLNEGAGSIVYDRSGNGNNGTIYGARWFKR